MATIFNTILLSTILICCSNSHSTYVYNPLYDIKRTILDNCSVETTDVNYGKLSYNGKLLVDINSYNYYDLKTMLTQSTIAHEKALPNFSGGNLIIKKLDDGSTDTYTMSISDYTSDKTSDISVSTPIKILLPSNTTLIIPQSITFAKYRVLLRAIEKENITIVNLGTMISDQYDAHINIMKSNNILVIIGPESRFPQLIGNYLGNNNGKYPISLWNNNGKDNKNTNVKYILYPGCKLNYNNDPIIANNEKCTISQYGRVYLNRFLPSKDERKELYGRISNEIHITYPNIKDEDEFNTTTVEGSVDYKTHTINTFFPKIYWVGDVNSHSEGTDNDTKTEYDYKEQEEPLYFNGNGVLDLKPKEENELAVYDAKLWNECGVNEGKYSLSYYNTPENNDKYINVDKAHEIFCGIDCNDDPIEIDADTLNLGLIGNRDVKLNTKSTTVQLLGDNSEFGGYFIIPHKAKINYGNNNKNTIDKHIKYYLQDGTISNTQDIISAQTTLKKEILKCKNQLNTEFRKIKDELSQIKTLLNKQNTTTTLVKPQVKPNFDLKYSNEIEVDLKDSMSTSQAIVLEDNGLIQNTILWLKGDNRDFKGMLITPKNIETVIFYPNSFCKVINPSGRKLKYKFVDEYGNTDDEYCSECKYHNKDTYKEYYDEEKDNKFMKKHSSSDDEYCGKYKYCNKNKYKEYYYEEKDNKFMKKHSSSDIDKYGHFHDKYFGKKHSKHKYSSSSSSSSSDEENKNRYYK